MTDGLEHQEEWLTSTSPLSLSDLVERTGVPASTIHHYRRLALIPPPARTAANRFSYDERHVEALRAIREGKAGGEAGARRRILAAAIDAFRIRSFGEVAVSDIADAAGVAKGSVYIHFATKEDLFLAAVEQVLDDTADAFAATVRDLGGRPGVAGDPEKAALVFAGLVAEALPLLLELGARAAKGYDDREDVLARRVLRTLAAAAGRPLVAADEDPVAAGLDVIQSAFATVLAWAVGPDWPPDAGADREAGPGC